MNLKKLLPYFIILAVSLGILYFLPSFGRFLRKIDVKITRFIKNIYYAQKLGKRYDELFLKQSVLQQRLVTFEEIQKENQFLRERLRLGKKEEEYSLVFASIIGEGSAFGIHTLVIDKGIKDKLKGGELVIVNPNILVGKISQLFEERAIVELVFNTDFSVSAKTARGLKGVVRGALSERVVIDEVSQTSDLQKGDIVLTDNKTPSIPANLLIGKVKEVISKPTDIYKKAELEVMFDFDTLERVFIILE